MKTNELTTKEVSVLTLKQSEHLKKYSKMIHSEMNKVENSFLKVAFCLYHIYEERLFTELGFDNIYDYAKREFDISRGTCNNSVNIVERFGNRTETGEITDSLREKYRKFKSSQLILMLQMDDTRIGTLDPAMSVRDMAKLLKEDKKQSNNLLNDSEKNQSEKSDSVTEDAQETEDIKVKEIRSNLIAEIKDFRELEEYRSTINKILKLGRKVQLIEIFE